VILSTTFNLITNISTDEGNSTKTDTISFKVLSIPEIANNEITLYDTVTKGDSFDLTINDLDNDEKHEISIITNHNVLIDVDSGEPYNAVLFNIQNNKLTINTDYTFRTNELIIIKLRVENTSDSNRYSEKEIQINANCCNKS
jgi:hypothetical protein